MSFLRTHWYRLIACLMAAFLVLTASASLAEIIVLQSGEELGGSYAPLATPSSCKARSAARTRYARLSSMTISPNDDEDVLLFLTVDPNAARLTDDKVVAIIKDDD